MKNLDKSTLIKANDVRRLVNPNVHCFNSDEKKLKFGHYQGNQTWIYCDKVYSRRLNNDNYFDEIDYVKFLEFDIIEEKKESDEIKTVLTKAAIIYERFKGCSKLLIRDKHIKKRAIAIAHSDMNFKLKSRPEVKEKDKENIESKPEFIDQTAHFYEIIIFNGKLFAVFLKKSDYKMDWLYSFNLNSKIKAESAVENDCTLYMKCLNIDSNLTNSGTFIEEEAEAPPDIQLKVPESCTENNSWLIAENVKFSINNELESKTEIDDIIKNIKQAKFHGLQLIHNYNENKIYVDNNNTTGNELYF